MLARRIWEPRSPSPRSDWLMLLIECKGASPVEQRRRNAASSVRPHPVPDHVQPACMRATARRSGASPRPPEPVRDPESTHRCRSRIGVRGQVASVTAWSSDVYYLLYWVEREVMPVPAER